LQLKIDPVIGPPSLVEVSWQLTVFTAIRFYVIGHGQYGIQKNIYISQWVNKTWQANRLNFTQDYSGQ